MPLTLSDSSLDWSLEHAIQFGDTDIFPKAFEFEAIKHDWAEIKKDIQGHDITKWTAYPFRRCLVPKHRFGFRVSTQLDPIDFLVFTALIKEIGEKLEAERVPTNENVVHSYRFEPKEGGLMFSEEHTYRTFQSTSLEMCKEISPTHVVVADIADFFPRLYTHRIDNALDRALGTGHLHGQALKRLIGQWAGSYSYGIPVGSAASRLIAEVTISDIDQLLLSEKTPYIRYSDDFRIFCTSEAEGYKYLSLLARALFENHGLTLQQHKTKIIPIDMFRSVYLRENEERELDTLSEKFHHFLRMVGVVDFYSTIDMDSLTDEAKEELDKLNIENILKEQLEQDEPDLSLLKFLLRRLAQTRNSNAVSLIMARIEKVVPVIREVIEYFLQLDISAENKKDMGNTLIEIYRSESSMAPLLEYSRMYMLIPFASDNEWNSEKEYVPLYNDATDEYAKRELLVAMGRGGQDFWFRSRKQNWQELPPWLRRAFIYSASCLPSDEYKHWIRGIDAQLNTLERAITRWAKASPINQ